MKALDWVKWLAATVVASVSMTVTALSYLESSYTSKEIFVSLEKKVDLMEDRIYHELQQIREILVHGDENRKRK